MMNRFLIFAFSLLSFGAFGQANNIENTLWQIDSIKPVSDTETDLKMIAAMSLLEEADRPAYLKMENQTISLLNSEKSILKENACYINPISQEGQYSIEVENQNGSLQFTDEKHAMFTIGNAIYYLRDLD